MSIPPKTFVTPEEYLELERKAEQESLEAVGLDALIDSLRSATPSNFASYTRTLPSNENWLCSVTSSATLYQARALI
jgi:hypothetical protein